MQYANLFCHRVLNRNHQPISSRRKSDIGLAATLILLGIALLNERNLILKGFDDPFRGLTDTAETLETRRRVPAVVLSKRLLAWQVN